MRRYRISFIILIICAFYPQKIMLGTNQKWTIRNIIDIARSHSAQTEDIQYTYKVQRIPIAEPNHSDNYEISTMWVPEKDWEKRTTKEILYTSPGKIYMEINAWNGEVNKTNTISMLKDEKPTRLEGEVSSGNKKGFSAKEPLQLLGIKRSKKSNLVNYLSKKDVLVEGVESFDGHETVVVSVNLITALQREESLIMKYWLDMKCGALPRRTEVYHKGELKRVTSDVTISEIKPGLFFPTACKCKLSGGESKGILSQGVLNIIQVDVKSIKVNQGLQKRDFDIEFEYGQPVWNEDVDLLYYEGLGLEGMKLTDELMLADLAKETKHEYENARAATLETQDSDNKKEKQIEKNNEVLAGKNTSYNLEEKITAESLIQPHMSKLLLLTLATVALSVCCIITILYYKHAQKSK